MTKLLPRGLSRREREIMTVLYERGEATATEVQEALTNPPTNQAVRALLRILEDKGQIQHKQEGARFIYTPCEAWPAVARSAIEQVVQTFFDGSVERAVATLLSGRQGRPSDEELTRLEELIRQAKLDEPAGGSAAGGGLEQ